MLSSRRQCWASQGDMSCYNWGSKTVFTSMYSHLWWVNFPAYITIRKKEWRLCASGNGLNFLCPPDKIWGAYCFCPVCLSVCLSVCLFEDNFNIGHNFWAITDRDLIFGMHVHLIKPHILRCNLLRSRSSFKVKGQNTGKITHFNIGHNFWSNWDRHSVFGVNMYLTKPHVLSGYILRSRSFFKVKGQI